METYYQPSKLQDEQVRTTGWMEHHIPYSILHTHTDENDGNNLLKR